MPDPRCLPRIPFEKWAVDAGLENGHQDWENWRYLRVWAQQLLSNCLGSGEFTASWADSIPIGISSMITTRYYPPGGWSINQLRASVDGNQVGDDLIFQLLVNGVPAGSVTILDGANYGEASISASGTDGDYLQYGYVSGANGASLLTVQGIGTGVSAGLDFNQIQGG